MTKATWYVLLVARLVLAVGISVGGGWIVYQSGLGTWWKIVLDMVVIGGLLGVLLVGPLTYSQRRHLRSKIDVATHEADIPDGEPRPRTDA